MATYKKLGAAEKRDRVVAPKVAKAQRVIVAKAALGRVKAKAAATTVSGRASAK